jgi:metal-responsive CopG/Arc/MetJ family transcriptional regulator
VLTIVGTARIIEMRYEQMAKVNISIPNDILDEIDRLSEEENMTRSELLRTAFRRYKEFVADKKREKKRQERIAKAIQIQDDIRNEIGDMDLIADLRKWRDERK